MSAIDLNAELVPAILKSALEHGLLLGSAGKSTIRILPPLTLTRADIDQGIQILDSVLTEVSAS